ncbi:putative proteasome endopeptidase complex [Helianthus debilis subsp. tardiflorus]
MKTSVVANSTTATFLRVFGSELIQKYLGDGPKLVRELFRVADDLSPSIVFIDEIDVVGTKRYDAHSSGEREIQRTMLKLLNQLDGFDSRGDVKVILATNKIESLDPALLRPGRIDRKIEFPYILYSSLLLFLFANLCYTYVLYSSQGVYLFNFILNC